MRQFKFIGDPNDYAWNENLVRNKIYPENFNNTHNGKTLIDCINRPQGFEYDPREFSNDWEEVFLEDLKYTDSGLSFQELRDNVINWAKDRDLIRPENQFKQFAKSVEEIGELGRGMLKNDSELIKDSMGDTLVTLIILSEQLGIDPVECLELAYNEIKDRKGLTKNGTFIKE